MKRCRSLLQLHFHQQSTHYDVDWMDFTEFRVSIIVTNVKKFFGSERRLLTSWFTVHEDCSRFQTKNAADEWKSFFLCLWNSLVSFEVKTSHLREVFLDLGRNYSWVEHHNVHYWLQNSIFKSSIRMMLLLWLWLQTTRKSTQSAETTINHNTERGTGSYKKLVQNFLIEASSSWFYTSWSCCSCHCYCYSWSK